MESLVETFSDRLAGVLLAGLALLSGPPAKAAEREAHDATSIKRDLPPNDLLAQAAVPPTEISKPDYILKQCKETEPTPDDPASAFRVVDPAYMLKNYFRSVGLIIELAEIKTTLLQGSSHGKIVPVTDNLGRGWYRYDPKAGFLGNDRAVFMAEQGGKRYKIVLDIKVLAAVDDKSPECPAPKLIKVSKPRSNLDLGGGALLAEPRGPPSPSTLPLPATPAALAA